MSVVGFAKGQCSFGMPESRSMGSSLDVGAVQITLLMLATEFAVFTNPRSALSDKKRENIVEFIASHFGGSGRGIGSRKLSSMPTAEGQELDSSHRTSFGN